jgi:hypothetical protein
MDQQFITETFCVDDEATRAIRPQTDDFTNDAIARHFDGRETARRIEGPRQSRAQQ